jgi:hypothetical protein
MNLKLEKLGGNSLFFTYIYVLFLRMKATFTKKNYMILVTGVILIGLGYLLMMGGGSDDPNVFNPAIFDAQRITIAPIVCLLGFAAVIVSIMWKDKSSAQTEIKK